MTDEVMLKCALIKKGITVRDLCSKCGFSYAYYYKCMRGEQDFRTNEVKAMADVLDLSATELTAIFFSSGVAH